MFEKMFLNTRSSIDRIHRQLRLAKNIFIFSVTALFLAYYAYLIVVNKDKAAFLITYIILLGLTLLMGAINIYFLFLKEDNRVKRRLNKEKKRKWLLAIRIVKFVVRVVTISLAGYELIHYGGSDIQLITFILSIVLLIVSIVVTIVIDLIIRYFDMLLLSIDMDIEKSKVLSFVARHKEKEHTDEELEIIDTISENTEKYKERKGLSKLFKK